MRPFERCAELIAAARASGFGPGDYGVPARLARGERPEARGLFTHTQIEPHELAEMRDEDGLDPRTASDAWDVAPRTAEAA